MQQVRAGVTPGVWGDDQVDWSRGMASHRSELTGPFTDHTNERAAGFYMFLDAENNPNGSRGSLISPSMPASRASCLRFWYHMMGPDIRTLRVWAVSQAARRTVWQRSGSQGERWNLGSVTLVEGTERFLFDGTVGRPLGEIAIDDVTVRGGPCQGGLPGCPNQQCQNGGRCIFNRNLYCQCINGWTGAYCTQRNTACMSRPCRNGGTCRVTSAGYICSCRLGFSGTICEIGRSGACQSQPCLNGGLCLDNQRTMSFWCVCPQGYTGKYCQKRRFAEHLDARLAGGSSPLEGRVEVFYNRQWGTVCSDGFGDLAAQTVCLQLGFKGRARAYSDLRYGEGTGPIWLDGVGCDYTYDNLKYCCHNEYGLHDCTHSKDVGVRCFNDSNVPLGDYTDFRDGTGFSTITPPTTTSSVSPGVPYNERLVICDFEATCIMQQATNDGFDWLLFSGNTPSFETGPKSDHTTGSGQYMYLEASGHRPNQTARVESPVLPFNEIKCLAFSYYMYGQDMGELSVYLLGAQRNQRVWRMTGNQGEQWKEVVIEIPAAITRVAIEGVTGSGYKADIAIDDLIIVRGLCKDYTGFPDTGMTRQTNPPGSSTTPRTTPTDTPTASPSSSSTSQTTPTTETMPTTRPSRPSSTAFSPSTGPPGPSTTPFVFRSSTRPSPPSEIRTLTCSFDQSGFQGGCVELIQEQDDDFDWTLNSKGTRSPNTGPNGDHTTGSGNYMYTEASNRGNTDIASLRTSIVGGEPLCLSLYYSMFGQRMGELAVYQDLQDGQGNRLLWKQSGNHPQRWFVVRIPLQGSNYTLRIQGKRGIDYSSDMAIDDLEIFTGNCFDFKVEQRCTFEPGQPCFLRDGIKDDVNWDTLDKRTPSDDTGPTTSNGYFVFLEASNINPGDNATLVSPSIPADRSRCLSFRYHMLIVDGRLNVFLTDAFGETNIFTNSVNRGDVWRDERVTIPRRNRPYVISIQAIRGSDYHTDIAIDDVRLSPFSCS